jgi:hypothetical protein
MRCAQPVLTSGLIGLLLVVGMSGVSVGAPDESAQAAASQVAPLPENAAEIAAIASGELVLEPAPAAEASAAPALSPEMVEINAALAAERQQVSDLTARLRATTDNAAALRLEREIETTKQSTELAVLGIQARYARAAGREQQAQAIEASIAQMTALMNGTPDPATVPPAVPQAPRSADGAR